MVHVGVGTHREKVCKKVKSWHQTSWDRFMKPNSPVENSWSMVRSNNPLKKRTPKGVPGLNPYTQIKLNKMSNFYSQDCSEDECKKDLALTNTEVEDFAGATNSISEVWIGDTGSSCHLVTSDKGLINIKIIDEGIKVGNGSTMSATKMGDLPVTIKQKDGTTTRAT